MGRRKTTVYLDPNVVTAVKVLAATRQQSDSDLIEDAVRAYLRMRIWGRLAPTCAR